MMKIPTVARSSSPTSAVEPSWSQLQLESLVLLAELQEVAGVPQMVVPHGVAGLPQVVVLQLQEVAVVPQVVVPQDMVAQWMWPRTLLMHRHNQYHLCVMMGTLLQASSMEVDIQAALHELEPTWPPKATLVLLAPASFVASALVALVASWALVALLTHRPHREEYLVLQPKELVVQPKELVAATLLSCWCQRQLS